MLATLILSTLLTMLAIDHLVLRKQFLENQKQLLETVTLLGRLSDFITKD